MDSIININNKSANYLSVFVGLLECPYYYRITTTVLESKNLISLTHNTKKYSVFNYIVVKEP